MITEPDVFSLIYKLSQIDVYKKEIEDIKDLLLPFSNLVEVTIYQQPANHLLVSRGKIVKTKPLIDKEISYCPPEFCNKFGRLNMPQLPIFYGSIGVQTYEPILSEIDARVGDFVAIGTWTHRASIKLTTIGYRNAVFSELSSSRKALPYDKIANINPGKIKLIELIKDEMGKIFSKRISESESEKYKLGIGIIETWFNFKVLDIDALLYPSVVNTADYDNIGIRKEYVDEYLMLLSVNYVEVTGISPYKYKLLNRTSSISSNGNILWDN